MPTYLRPTELAKYLDVAPQKISQLRARGIITPEQDGSYEADATRVAYIRNLRAHVVPAASASLTEERALLLRARRARMELETARMRGGTITPEEDERRLEMIRSRLEDIPAGYSNGIAEAARRADGINEANAAVGVRLRSAMPTRLGRPPHEDLHAALTLFDPGSATRRAEAERISKLWLIPLRNVG